MVNTRLTEHTGVEHPIICGAMYPCSNPDLIAAAANGGGMAIIQPVSLTVVHGFDKPDLNQGLIEGIRYIRSKTDKPLGFNALIEKGSDRYLQRMSEWIDIALDEGIRFFVTSLGKPDWVCERVHSRGGYVYHDVTTRLHAEKGIECGVDGLICVNDRAGGHLGNDSMEQMYASLSDLGLPLICAGGIGSEEELKDAIRIGYDGVQMGTRFIATDECSTGDGYKQAIVRAREEDIDWTVKLTGVPVSVIKTPSYRRENPWLVRVLLSGRFKHRTRWLMNMISFRRWRKMSKGAKQSDIWSAGKSVETIESIESATTIMMRLGKSLEYPDES
ncbi:MAG: nitronate monooxygenase [Candidatus Thalassarchaeaceae archaeon]|nr:nitronate monooxygenase [Candidatus Thalassarchaeaceae archaeon]